jgi:hypothetical protein
MSRRHSCALVILVALISNSGTSLADAALDWNEIALASLPASDSRTVAITQLAVFEAVNAITQDYEPYLGTISAPPGASAEAAAVAAAHAVLRHYAASEAADLDAARERSLATITDGPSKKAGIGVGMAAAQAMIALRANDGFVPPRFYQPTSSEPGDWQLTPGCPPEGGAFLHLRDVTPFGVRRVRRFRHHCTARNTPPRIRRSNGSARWIARSGLRTELTSRGSTRPFPQARRGTPSLANLQSHAADRFPKTLVRSRS